MIPRMCLFLQARSTQLPNYPYVSTPSQVTLSSPTRAGPSCGHANREASTSIGYRQAVADPALLPVPPGFKAGSYGFGIS